MRLVAYTDAAGVGGAEISLANLVAALPQTEHPFSEVVAVGSNEEVVRRIAGEQVEAIVAPVRRHPALLARLRPDVLHANLCVPWACSLAMTTGLALPRTRVVAVQQLPLRTVELPRWLRTRMLLSRVDAHVAVGEASARRVEDFYALGRGTVRSIPNFVPDLELTATAPAHRPLTIGSIGRLDRVKGYDLLLAALAELPDARLVVLGEGEERAALEKQAAELGIADRVELPGWDDNPRRRLAEWDIFCLPSRSEGFPLSIVEAMLAGLPVVGTHVGSVGEAVAHERTGLLVERDDVDGLADALRRLVDPDYRARLGAAGRQRAQENFTVERMAEAYVQLYRELLASPRRSRLRPPAPKP